MKLIFVLLTLIFSSFVTNSQTIVAYSANIAQGKGTDNVTNYQRQVDSFADGDIIFVQERVTGQTGWNTPLANAGFAEAIYKENGHGNDGPAIWYNTSTVTINATYSHDLSTGFIGWNGTQNVDKAVVAAKVTAHGRQFYVVSTHLCWSACADSEGSQFSSKRVSQATELMSWINTTLTGGLDILLGGDMNFGPNYPKSPSGLQKDIITGANFVDLWNVGITAGTATANWGDRDTDTIADMPVSDLGTRTHDTRRIDYFFLNNPATDLSLSSISVPDIRATCSTTLTFNGSFKECPDVLQLWDVTDDQGPRPQDHNLVRAVINISPQTVTANAGADRIVFTNETIVLDGTASTGGFDGFVTSGGNLTDQHAIKWTFGYGSWDWVGNLSAPIAYPKAGVYTATLTVCNSTGTCASDTAQITVTDITCSSEVVISNSGNATTNMTNLQTEINNSTGTNTKCITLFVGEPGFRGTLELPHRTVANYLTIRTANHASLPSIGTRVFPADASNMAIMEVTNNATIIETPVGNSTTPARYYNFIGIHLRKNVATFQYNSGTFVKIGRNTETALNQLPNHIGFDRCFFDGGSQTSDTWRGLWINGSDVFITNSYLYRFKGVALETQAILVITGERMTFLNNYMNAGTEDIMFGGTTHLITNHLPIYIVFRRNDVDKDIGWCSFCGSYAGVNMSIKNNFEIKYARFISMQGNLVRNHWQEDQDYAFAITVRGEDGAVPWAEISYFDFSYNKIDKIGRGVHYLCSDESPSGNINHTYQRHNIFTGVSFWNSNPQTHAIRQGNPALGCDKLYLVRNSTDQNGDPGAGQGRWIEFDNSSSNTNLFIVGNIGQGYFAGAGGTGTNAINGAADSWTVIKNGFYRSTGTNPTDNTAVSTLADVKYVDVTNANLSLAGDSPFLTTGLNGQRSGADVDMVNTLTSGTITGVWPDSTTIKKCNWHTIQRCNQ